MSSHPPARRRLPAWLRRTLSPHGGSRSTSAVLRRHGLHTVCEEARCPNRHECYSRRVATFMILGDTCTRNCRFCATATATTPLPPPSADEPERVAAAAAELGLAFVVVTSVTRDDLADGGAGHFAATCRCLRERLPQARIELLVPDFAGDEAALATVAAARPDVLNHNIETVPRLSAQIRPGAEYRRSLALLQRAREAGVWTKSGLMVGLGERDDEVRAVLGDLRASGVDLVTIGQYLQPCAGRLPVARFVPPEGFERYCAWGRELGFAHLEAGPFVRSSYLAERAYQQLHRPPYAPAGGAAAG